MTTRASGPAIRAISSRQHPLVATCRRLARGDDHARLLLDGPHLLAEALDSGVHVETVAFTATASSDSRTDVARLCAKAHDSGAEVVQVTESVMDAMSPVRTPAGVVAIAARPQHPLAPTAGIAPLLLIAVDVQDPGNLGAVVRAAEAGGATGVIVTGVSADPFSWKALRGSMGSALRVPIVTAESVEAATATARGLGCRVLASEPRVGDPFTEVPLTEPVAILLGGEGPGLTLAALEQADATIRIPMRAPVESLNVAVTAALLVFEAQRQRDLAKRQ